jgi:hypothetical protein
MVLGLGLVLLLQDEHQYLVEQYFRILQLLAEKQYVMTDHSLWNEHMHDVIDD